MQDIITVNHLSKSYGSHQVLNDISFSFQPGQIIALLGPNGSGKSSLIKILTGLIHDYSGEVLIDGEVRICPRSRILRTGCALSTR